MPERPPTWIAAAVVLAIHDEQLAEHGGLPGVRSREPLSSALARPQHLRDYGDAAIAELAASCAFGIARNFPFADGNKRTAPVAAETFLLLNGYVLQANDADCVSTFVALAAGELTEKELAAWISEHIGAART